ncbi:MAG: aldo/keto reductase [Sandaracinaceae bacterium]
MRYVTFGRTGLRVSTLALGTMPFGGDADEPTSAAIYGQARDAGINYFDTADVYNHGESERILGRLCAGHRDEIVIATKAYFPTGDGVNDRSASRFHLVRALEKSLVRLGTDRVDVFFVHRFDDVTPLEETLETLERLADAGKVLYPAVSNFAAWQVMKAIGIQARRGFSKIVALQPMYNLVKRTAEIELLPMAASEGLAVTPYSPLGGGLLSGKYGDTMSSAPGRLSTNAMYQRRYEGTLGLAQAFAGLARELGIHPVTLAIAWVGHHPAVTAPLIGARNVEQLTPALAAADLELDHETYARVAALVPAPPPATDRNEEGSADDYAKVVRR